MSNDTRAACDCLEEFGDFVLTDNLCSNDTLFDVASLTHLIPKLVTH